MLTVHVHCHYNIQICSQRSLCATALLHSSIWQRHLVNTDKVQCDTIGISLRYFQLCNLDLTTYWTQSESQTQDASKASCVQNVVTLFSIIHDVSHKTTQLSTHVHIGYIHTYTVSALILLVGWQEGHQACKKILLRQSPTVIPNCSPLEAFGEPAEPGIISGK